MSTNNHLDDESLISDDFLKKKIQLIENYDIKLSNLDVKAIQCHFVNKRMQRTLRRMKTINQQVA